MINFEFIKKYIFFFILFVIFVSSNFYWLRFKGIEELRSENIRGDSWQYHYTALNLLYNNVHGYYYGENPENNYGMDREPGYPFFLSVIYRIFGINFKIVRLISYLMNFAIVAMVFYVANKTFGVRVARVSSFLAALSPIHHIFTASLMSEILATFIFLLFLTIFTLAQQKKQIFLFGFSGLLFGAFVLVKSAFIVIVPFAAGLIFLLNYKKNWRKGLLCAIFLLGFFSFLVLPWMYRNYKHFDSLAISSRGGSLFFLRTLKTTYSYEEIKKYAISSFTGEYLVRRFIDPDYSYEREGQGLYKMQEIKENFIAEGKIKNNDDVDHVFLLETIKMIKEHPFKFILYGFIEINNLNSPIIYYDRHFAIFHDNIYQNTAIKITTILVLRLLWWIYLLFVLFGMIKVILIRQNSAYLLILCLLVINFIFLFLQGLPRSLMPIHSVYFMLASFGLVSLLPYIKRTTFKSQPKKI